RVIIFCISSALCSWMQKMTA
ncbi:hypothetical protein SLEP1_g59948, partial [Rubroshorea leprosula]